MWSFVPVVVVGLCVLLFPSKDERLEEAAAQLASGDKWIRKGAVEDLAKLGTSDAWQHVIGALADQTGEVADTAQLLLGGILDPEVVRVLQGRTGLGSKDAWVRLRAAEALGRVVLETEARGLLGALDDREPDVRCAVLGSLERLAVQGLVVAKARKRVVQAVRKRSTSDRNAFVRARALAALVGLEGTAAAAEVRRAVHDREPVVRAVAAGVLGTTCGAEGACAVLSELVADRSRGVRVRAVEALGRIGTRDAVRLLVPRLGDEGDARLRGRVVDVLRGLSGLKHRTDPRPWRAWVAGLSADWRGTLKPLSSGAGASDERTATFAGLPILSERLTFLIDLSGSIWRERDDGTTRKEAVDAKLGEALQRLPEGARFNVIPFTSRPYPWQERLMSASKRNVRSALAYFEGLRESGSGNVWDAIQLALRDPEVDTLVILSDGAPTGGPRHRLELMIPLLVEQNAGRAVAFDVVLVGASRKLQRFWGRLARESGGACLNVEL